MGTGSPIRLGRFEGVILFIGLSVAIAVTSVTFLVIIPDLFLAAEWYGVITIYYLVLLAVTIISVAELYARGYDGSIDRSV